MTALYDNVFKHTTDMCNEEAGGKFLKKYNTFVAQTTRKWLSRHTHHTCKSHSIETDGAISSETRTITAETFARCRKKLFYHNYQT
jgi:hypothetical protein